MFHFCSGSAPDPAGGAYSAPHADPLAGIQGAHTSKGRGEKGRGNEGRKGMMGRGKGKGEERKGRRERGGCAPQTKILPTPL